MQGQKKKEKRQSVRRQKDVDNTMWGRQKNVDNTEQNGKQTGKKKNKSSWTYNEEQTQKGK